MNFRAIAIVVFLVVVSGGLLVHFRQQSITGATSTNVPVEGIPVPPPTGPYGKFVVVSESVHDFGVMELHQKGSHEFKIRNDGPGPLKMVARKEDHTCQCTLGSLASDGLKPGEESIVTMAWEIKNPASNFQHSAKIRTDDPENPVITFLVRGLVGERLTTRVGSTITIGQLAETKATERTIVIHSEIADHFEITKLESSNPAIAATSQQLFGDKLREAAGDPSFFASSERIKEMASSFQKARPKEDGGQKKSGEPDHEGDTQDPTAAAEEMMGKHAPVKSGHEVKVVFNPGLPIGKFRESLIIYTNIPETPPLVVFFEGNRAGPVEILGTPGVAWSPQEVLLRVPRFRAQEGKKVKLLVFVKKTEVPWEITDSKISPPFMKNQLIKDEKFKGMGRDRYDLIIEIPAGEAPTSFSGTMTGSLTLNTSHPDAKEIRLGVDFTSY